MKKISRSEKKHLKRLLSKANRTIERYRLSNVFSNPISEEQKVAYFSALYVKRNVRKELGYDKEETA